MMPGKALLAALPLALGGGWLIAASTSRVGALRAELEALDTQGREEGDSFVRTLQGSHVERQLDILSRRQATVVALAAARRNQLLGVVLVLASCLAFAFVRAAQRVANEIEEDATSLARHRTRRDDTATPS
jgi:hypothetical protein